MLIYTLLGEQAEKSFARSWGISYGLNAAAQWKARRLRGAVSPSSANRASIAGPD